MTEEVRKDHAGLSPSSLSLFQSCARKYYLKKVAKVPIDDDASEDTEAFDIGKAFHKVLEDNKHELKGLKYQSVADTVVGLFDLTEHFHLPMIFSMLAKYKILHEKAGLKAIACEVELETDTFYGFIDVILQEPDGRWWIADIKTAASYTPGLLPSLPKHQQLNLYAAHAYLVAEKLSLDLHAYAGIRYRVITKSRIGRKKDEKVEDFLKRLSSSVQAYDVAIPKEIMNVVEVLDVHYQAFKHTRKKKEKDFPRNYGSCFAYYKPCEMWSKCHGHKYSEIESKMIVTDAFE